jgi:beta-1,4-mannosyl-glycoprotein beta-1,4-N-acetylglucosaminyltransferase
MKIYDAFIFYNELDLLEIRLNILKDKVDYFILGEACQCFGGQNKPLYFNENRERFKEFENKIIYCPIGKIGEDKKIYEKSVNSPNTNGDPRWVNEFYQKEMMIHGTKNLHDEDIIFVSDVDEIWDPNLNIDQTSDKTYRPIQQSRPIYLNVLSDQDVNHWVGTRYGKIKTLRKYGFNHFRSERDNPSIPIPNSGWHFSWLGCNHWDKWGYGDEDGKIRFSRIVNSNKILEETTLPEYLKKNKNKWNHLFLSQ